MKSISCRDLVKLAACLALTIGLNSVAAASCGDSLAAMAGGGTMAKSSVAESLADAATPSTNNSSIVGLWHIQLLVGGQPIQEAFQVWNLGGTEVHNPNVNPAGGTMCLGTWIETKKGEFKLAHRVWNYDTSGNFLGVIHLTETVRLNHNGSQHTGSFALDFYDPNGNFVTEVAGSVAGFRIQVE